jgi:hypothetical protein
MKFKALFLIWVLCLGSPERAHAGLFGGFFSMLFGGGRRARLMRGNGGGGGGMMNPDRGGGGGNPFGGNNFGGNNFGGGNGGGSPFGGGNGPGAPNSQMSNNFFGNRPSPGDDANGPGPQMRRNVRRGNSHSSDEPESNNLVSRREESNGRSRIRPETRRTNAHSERDDGYSEEDDMNYDPAYDEEGANLYRSQPYQNSNPGYIPRSNDIPMLRDTLAQQPNGTPPVATSNGRQVRLAELDGVMTATHESCHGTNSMHANANPGYEALYDPYKGAILVPKSGIYRSYIINNIPQSLRGNRFETYIQSRNGGLPMAGTLHSSNGSKEDADLTYLWDEWDCYRVGGLAGLEAMSMGVGENPNDDLFAGIMEFTLYAAASLKTAYEGGSNSYQAMRDAFAYIARSSMKTVIEGEQMNPANYSWTSPWWGKFHSADAQPLMQFLAQEYGADWVNELFAGNSGDVVDSGGGGSGRMY